MRIPLTPHECIKEALIANSAPEEGVTNDRQLFNLCEAVLKFLDAKGYTIIDRDAVWDFHDSLDAWLNQDSDEHRISTFSPYQEWLDVFRLLPPRRDTEGNVIIGGARR